MKLKWQINDEEPIIKELDDFDLTQIKLCLMPSADVVEVIRCKDCEFYDFERTAGLKNHGYCEVYKGYKKADGFCDIGERREGNG